jgi:ribose 5-phosphate isomerase B
MIAIACDHGAVNLKKEIIAYLNGKNIAYKDFGTYSAASCDYADFAIPAAEAVARGEFQYGILLCGTGIGMSIAANKVKGVRAAAVTDEFSAKATRAHNDANILCMGERVLGSGLAISILDVFLNTPFEGGRHKIRIDKIAGYEKNRR